MRDLISRAYQLAPIQVIGPAWLDDGRLDLVDHVPPGTTPDRVPHVLQVFLAQRFKLAAHHETRTMNVFPLELAPGGPKLDETPSWNVHGGTDGCEPRPGGNFFCQMTSTPELAGLLEREWLGVEPILDRTGLKSVYDFIVENPHKFDLGAKRDAPVAFKVQAIQDQIKSLGLTIEQRKEPIDVLVVDHCEKNPSRISLEERSSRSCSAPRP